MSVFEDEHAVRKLAHAYADAVCRRDPEAMVAVYAPDGELEVASTGVSIKGREKLLRGFRRLIDVDRQFNALMMTSSVIEVDGDRARGRHWFIEIKQHTGESFHRYVAGVYQDEAVRLPEGWRFSRRSASSVFEWQLPSDGPQHFPLPPFLPITPF